MGIAPSPYGSHICLKDDLGFDFSKLLRSRTLGATPPPHFSLNYLEHALLCGQSGCVEEGLMVMVGRAEGQLSEAT